LKVISNWLERCVEASVNAGDLHNLSASNRETQEPKSETTCCLDLIGVVVPDPLFHLLAGLRSVFGEIVFMLWLLIKGAKPPVLAPAAPAVA
jgi:hypothetical protein